MASSTATAEASAPAPTTALKNGLKEDIAGLYDESSGVWETICGDHLHHGFYPQPAGAASPSVAQAQIRTIDEALAFAAVPDDPGKKPKTIVDVGCGIGGSSRYLARKYGAQCTGITLSPVQAARGNALAEAQGLSDKVSLQVADALDQPFPDGMFDLVWAMESAEHMPDKAKFVSELARVAAPGGTIIIVTCCHRNLEPSETSLKPDELSLLKRISNAYCLADWCSPSEYINIAKSLSLEWFQDIRTADWSENVAPFWPAVIKLSLSWKGLTSALTCGWKTMKGAMGILLLIQGYKKGLIRFTIITCRKPSD